jgi:hypothetical protein
MRKHVALALIAFSIFTTSCNGLTKKLWNWHGYEENFKHFLINQQNGYVVFLAQKFHYIFIDNSNLMKNILLWQDRRTLFIDTSETEIHVDKNNQASGEVMIRSFSENLMPHREAFLINHGFKRDNKGWYLKLKIFGTRYLANPNIHGNFPQLDLSYKIKIAEDLKKGEILTATTLTPIAITADGIITIGKILLSPFGN